MILKQKSLIPCIALTLLCATASLFTRSGTRHSALFTSLDVDENDTIVQQPIKSENIEQAPLNGTNITAPDTQETARLETNMAQKNTPNNKEKLEEDIAFGDPTLPQESFLQGDEIPKEFRLKDLDEHPSESPLVSAFEKTEEEDAIEFNFEDADIQNLLTQISEIFDISFITDEILNPMGPNGKALKGNKISFKTHKPLSRDDAWNLFLTFLDLAGFALVPEPESRIYRVVASEKAQQFPVPTYIGTSVDDLPNNDQMIRYVYFIENADITTLKDVVGSLIRPGVSVILLQEIKAFVITDRAYNIKSLMQIVREFDQVSMPQAMSVLKLRTTDATDVKKLYDSIANTEGQDGGVQTRMPGARKQSPAIYFPENARVIAEPRTNSLIILGPKDGIEKIENFVLKYVDVELEKPYSPLQGYQLRYASATTIAEIMNNMSQFGADTAAGKAGGVRGGDQYLKTITFTPEPTTNTIVIKGEYDDYLKALEIIKRLDEPQPQVAIEALILTMDFDDNRQIGAQIRNKIVCPSNVAANIDFQTSGLALGGTPQGIITNNSGSGANRLLANLINLVSGATAGNTVVSLGYDAFGVWGIFNVLQTITNTQVVSNPFLVATNKTEASVSIGEVRRVQTSQVLAGENNVPAFGDYDAQLKLTVTPQINSDGMIILKLNVLFENFISSILSTTQAAKRTRTVDTQTLIADREVIAIGGLVENNITESVSEVPILGRIPILGWLFRNRGKEVTKTNLLILISTKIIEPEATANIDSYTQDKLEEYYHITETFYDAGEHRDPLARRFFGDQTDDPTDVVENFFFSFSREREPSDAPERNGKFYRPGAKKEAAIIAPPEEEAENNAPLTNTRNYTRSDLFKDMMDRVGPVVTAQKKKPARKRDARRTVQPADPAIGVLT